jgi:hypothetical protein
VEDEDCMNVYEENNLRSLSFTIVSILHSKEPDAHALML